MPVVTKEQLKIWFSNFKKPPEGEFWAWVDSFRHILDKVPLDDVEGLTEKLQKKADLVDGVVPENQLPFSVVTSEVITLGLVSVVDNELDLAVHSSGANKVRVKGKTIIRTFPNAWNFTPIENNGVKVIRGFAEKNQDDFFISEGPELPEFELPEIPEDALQLFIVTITQAGATIDTGSDSGFKYKAESGWKSLLITSNNPRWITLTSDESTFEITEQNASTPLISGLLTKGGKWIYPGKVYGLFNASGRDVTIRRNDVRPPFNPIQIANYLTFLTTEDIVVKPGEYFWFKIKGVELVALKFSRDFDPTILQNQINSLESEIDAEIVNRASADFLKLDKPTSDGIFRIKKAGNTITYEDATLQIYKIISANAIIDNTFHNTIVFVTANCTITLPQGLRTDLNFVCRSYAGATGTFASSGSAVISGESHGNKLAESSMCSVVKNGTNSYLLSGTTT